MLRQQLTEQQEKQALLLRHTTTSEENETNNEVKTQPRPSSSLTAQLDQEHKPKATIVNRNDFKSYGSASASASNDFENENYNNNHSNSNSGGDLSVAPSSEEGNEDESEYSYESEYDEEDDVEDNSDEDENGSSMRRKQKNCCSSSCCDDKKKRRRRRRHRGNGNTSDDDLDEKRWKVFKPVLSPVIKVYQVAKEAFILITNVDDVWDSPALVVDNERGRNDDLLSRSRSDSAASSTTYRGYGVASFSRGGTSTGSHNPGEDNSRETNIGPSVSFRHKVGVLFWFLVLATAYASERGTFKVMVDRMGPFRMVVGAESVMAVHALILASWMLIRSITCGRKNMKGTAMLPLVDIGSKCFFLKFPFSC